MSVTPPPPLPLLALAHAAGVCETAEPMAIAEAEAVVAAESGRPRARSGRRSGRQARSGLMKCMLYLYAPISSQLAAFALISQSVRYRKSTHRSRSRIVTQNTVG